MYVDTSELDDASYSLIVAAAGIRASLLSFVLLSVYYVSLCLCLSLSPCLWPSLSVAVYSYHPFTLFLWLAR